MGLAMFSALRDEHSQDTLPVYHWEKENEADQQHVLALAPDGPVQE